MLFGGGSGATDTTLEFALYLWVHDLWVRGWSAGDAEHILAAWPEEMLTRVNLAALLSYALHHAARTLVPPLAELWRRRAMRDGHWPPPSARRRRGRAHPLPRPGTAEWDAFDGHQAVASLVGTLDLGEVVRAVRGIVSAAGGRQVLNQVVTGLALVVRVGGEEDRARFEDCLRGLAQNPVRRLLRESTLLCLVMPPDLAACFPEPEWEANHLVLLMLQASRFVAVHQHLALPWTESFVGYLLLLHRCRDGLTVSNAARLREGCLHNVVTGGLLLRRAMDLDAAVAVGPVVFLLALTQCRPMHVAVETVQWLAQQRPRALLLASMRPLLQEGLAGAWDSEGPHRRLPPSTVLRSDVLGMLLSLCSHVPAAWECVLVRVPVEDWSVASVAQVLDHTRHVDEFVWSVAFRDGFPLLLVHLIVDDVRYSRREWQGALRLHHSIPSMGLPPRPTLSQSALMHLVSQRPVEAGALADTLNLLLLHGPTPLVWQWYEAAHPPKPGAGPTWSAARRFVAERLRRYVVHHACDTPAATAPRLPRTTALRLAEMLQGENQPQTLCAALTFLA